jgi:isoflavone/4'-methoxyisoflavone 2'-hydroxylase
MNVKEIAFGYVLNVVMGMIAGKRYYGDEAKDWEEARQFRQLIDEVSALPFGSRLVDFFPWFRIVDSVSVRKKIQAVVKRRNEFSQNLINEIRNGVDAQKKKTMIGDILQLQDREPEVYTDALIRSLSLVSFLNFIYVLFVIFPFFQFASMIIYSRFFSCYFKKKTFYMFSLFLYFFFLD